MKNGWFRYKKVEWTERGTIFLLLWVATFLGSWTTKTPFLFLISALLFSVLLASHLLSRHNGRAISMRLLPIPDVFAGQPARFVVRLVNPPKGGLAFGWQLGLIIDGKVWAESAVTYLAPDSHADVVFEGVFPHRGLCRVQGVLLSTGFPFGFRLVRRFEAFDRELSVFPEIRVAEAGLALAALFEDVNSNNDSTGYIPEDFSEIREFQPGDDFKRINWKASARIQELMVNRFVEQSSGACLLFFDNRLDKCSQADRAVFEAAVSIIATIVWKSAEKKRRIGLLTPEKSLTPQFGKGHARTLLRYLTVIQPIITGEAATNERRLDRGLMSALSLHLSFKRAESGDLYVMKCAGNTAGVQVHVHDSAIQARN